MNRLVTYAAVFRIRFLNGLQYRAAALAGVVTQFTWGGLNILLFRAFYQADPAAFPMDFQATASYIWLQQAFLALYVLWYFENSLFQSISDGGLAYELCRPTDLYALWFSRSMAHRLSAAILRCLPILGVALCLPAPYGLGLPANWGTAGLFLLAMVLAFLVVVAMGLVVYAICCHTLTAQGVRFIAVTLAEFFSGGLIPLPFLPDGLRQFCELLPFAAAQNVPLRIYGGDLVGAHALLAVGLQCFWLLALVLLGRTILNRALRRVAVQGG